MFKYVNFQTCPNLSCLKLPQVSIISEKVDKSVNKTSFDDDEVNFEEAVIETSAGADEDWAAKAENWQEAAESEAVQAATEEGWASWNETQQYKRQESRDSNIQVRILFYSIGADINQTCKKFKHQRREHWLQKLEYVIGADEITKH